MKINGKKIKELRKQYNPYITQLELAENIKISKDYIGSLEQGRITCNEEVLDKLVKFFNKPIRKNGFVNNRIIKLTNNYFLN